MHPLYTQPRTVTRIESFTSHQQRVKKQSPGDDQSQINNITTGLHGKRSKNASFIAASSTTTIPPTTMMTKTTPKQVSHDERVSLGSSAQSHLKSPPRVSHYTDKRLVASLSNQIKRTLFHAFSRYSNSSNMHPQYCTTGHVH